MSSQLPDKSKLALLLSGTLLGHVEGRVSATLLFSMPSTPEGKCFSTMKLGSRSNGNIHPFQLIFKSPGHVAHPSQGGWTLEQPALKPWGQIGV
jgi:hypothetical protein